MNTNRYHRPDDETEEEFTAVLLDDLEQAILAMGPETICLVHMEPVQNAGGAFTPPAGYWRGVRALCDRYDILLSADEVITGLRPASATGSARSATTSVPTSSAARRASRPSYAAIGAVIATDEVMEPFLEGASMYSHGITFGGHPVMSAIALKNIEIMKRERHHRARARERGRPSARRSSTLLDLPIVGDVRGTGYFYAIELDQEQRDARDVLRPRSARRSCAASSRRALFERGPDLPRRRSRRPGDPDLAAARRRPGRVRRDRRDPRRRARPRPATRMLDGLSRPTA